MVPRNLLTWVGRAGCRDKRLWRLPATSLRYAAAEVAEGRRHAPRAPGGRSACPLQLAADCLGAQTVSG